MLSLTQSFPHFLHKSRHQALRLAQMHPDKVTFLVVQPALAAGVISQPGEVHQGQVVRPGQPVQALREVGRALNQIQGPVQTIATGQTVQHILGRDQNHVKAQLIL